MNIEDKIFLRYTPEFEKLKKYGFTKNKNQYVIEKLFFNNLFKAVISISTNNQITGIVYDIENDDEFLPLRVENQQGSFVGEVRTEYQNLLEDIKEKCFIKKYFIYPQANRITNLIIKKYENKPEFLWDKFPGYGVFRNHSCGKWYLAILDVDRSKIQKDKTGIVEIALIKQTKEDVEKLTKQEHFYPGWHMNKKYWITVILDNTVKDNKIMELIDASYYLSLKK